MKSRLGQLRNKLSMSGINNHPIITDDELDELTKLYEELVMFLYDSNNITMAQAFHSEMINAKLTFGFRSR